MRIKLALVDDHVLLRNSLAAFLEKKGEYDIVAQASSGDELLKLLKTGVRPDVVLLDLNMPQKDGYATAEEMKKSFPEVKILVLSMFDSEVVLFRLLKSGVRGFLKKDVHPYDLETAIKSVFSTGYYYCNKSTGKMAEFFSRDEPGGRFEKSMLSEKEITFLKYVSSELTYKEIAAELGMTPRAIDGYRDQMFVKLDVKSRVGLVIYAVKNGIVTL